VAVSQLAETERSPKKGKKRRNLEHEITRVREEVGRAARQPGAVLAGPFTGEVGFELLYWIPFLRWAVSEFPDLRGRLVVISRGGVQGWLEGLDADYLDILSLFPAEDFARHRAIADKQREVADFDRTVIDGVKRHLGLERAAVIHPSVLYQSYFRFLKINQLAYPMAVTHTAQGVRGLTAIYEPIEPPDRGPLAQHLPDEYVAVRFYSSLSFPDAEDARRFVSDIIGSLSVRTNVVLLGQRFTLDEHRDMRGELPDGVITVDHLMEPDNNLALQTIVVGNAKAFVGTYGGFAYLAPFLNVPSLSFSMDRGRAHSWHYELAQRTFDGPEWGGFVALRDRDLAMVELVARDFAFDGVPSTPL